MSNNVPLRNIDTNSLVQNNVLQKLLQSQLPSQSQPQTQTQPSQLSSQNVNINFNNIINGNAASGVNTFDTNSSASSSSQFEIVNNFNSQDSNSFNNFANNGNSIDISANNPKDSVLSRDPLNCVEYADDIVYHLLEQEATMMLTANNNFGKPVGNETNGGDLSNSNSGGNNGGKVVLPFIVNGSRKYLTTAQQPDISERMRTILLDWMVDVCIKFKVHAETFFLSVDVIDRFLSFNPNYSPFMNKNFGNLTNFNTFNGTNINPVSNPAVNNNNNAIALAPNPNPISRSQLQLVGVSALLIAAKHEEIWPPEVKDCIYISANTYSRDEVVDMEQTIAKVLNFRFTVPTAYPFTCNLLDNLFNSLSKSANSLPSVVTPTEGNNHEGDVQKTRQQFSVNMLHLFPLIKHSSFLFLESSALDYSSLDYLPSQIANGAVLAALVTVIHNFQSFNGYVINNEDNKNGEGNVTTVHEVIYSDFMTFELKRYKSLWKGASVFLSNLNSSNNNKEVIFNPSPMIQQFLLTTGMIARKIATFANYLCSGSSNSNGNSGGSSNTKYHAVRRKYSSSKLSSVSTSLKIPCDIPENILLSI